jgi:hypothetical protein
MPEGLQGFFAKTNFSLSACFLSLAPSERKKERQGGREGERGKGKERERERERSWRVSEQDMIPNPKPNPKPGCKKLRTNQILQELRNLRLTEF